MFSQVNWLVFRHSYKKCFISIAKHKGSRAWMAPFDFLYFAQGKVVFSIIGNGQIPGRARFYSNILF